MVSDISHGQAARLLIEYNEKTYFSLNPCGSAGGAFQYKFTVSAGTIDFSLFPDEGAGIN